MCLDKSDKGSDQGSISNPTLASPYFVVSRVETSHSNTLFKIPDLGIRAKGSENLLAGTRG